MGFGRHWENLWNERYDFITKEKEIKALLGLDAGSVRDFFVKYLRHEASMRRLSIHIRPHKASSHSQLQENAPRGLKHKIIDDIQTWKSSQETYQPPARGFS